MTRYTKIIPNIFLLAGIVFVLMAGCAPIGKVDSPVQNNPAATPDALPAEAIPEPPAAAAAVPTSTPALLPTSADATDDTPISDQTGNTPADQSPAHVDFGNSEIAIIRPGQLSRHVSPIRLIVNLRPGPDRLVEITLYGEDGRIILHEEDYAHPFDDPLNGNLIKDLEFTIDGLAETGRLEMKVYDSFGRLKALNSVYLILLSSGITERNYAPETDERILLQLPFPDQLEIHSSPVFISGLVRTESENPLFVSLVDEHGETVGEGRASIVHPGSPEIGQFVGEIPYTVSQPTTVLLTFGLEEGRISGFTYVKTIEVTLYPPD
ncbi:MAG: hypothetical protein P8046_14205 [Anaerolineales bacterium]